MAAAVASPIRRLRWWGVVALVFIGQIGTIFWLSRTGPPAAHRPPSRGFGLALMSDPRGPLVAVTNLTLFDLTDPTLFALPHFRSFAGPAWMTADALPTNHFTWYEPARLLELEVARPASSFEEPVALKPFSLVDSIAQTHSEPHWPDAPVVEPAQARTTWRLAGDLASRRLRKPLDLHSITTEDLLTNTVVQLLVDAHGWPVSAAVLTPGSGSADADQQALSIASTARFEALPESGGDPAPVNGLRWGELVIDWHTIPPVSTNGVSEK